MSEWQQVLREGVDNLEKLVRSFPAFELRFELDKDFWPLIEEEAQ